MLVDVWLRLGCIVACLTTLTADPPGMTCIQGARNASAKAHGLIAKGLCARAFEKGSIRSVDHREFYGCDR